MSRPRRLGGPEAGSNPGSPKRAAAILLELLDDRDQRWVEEKKRSSTLIHARAREDARIVARGLSWGRRGYVKASVRCFYSVGNPLDRDVGGLPPRR